MQVSPDSPSENPIAVDAERNHTGDLNKAAYDFLNDLVAAPTHLADLILLNKLQNVHKEKRESSLLVLLKAVPVFLILGFQFMVALQLFLEQNDVDVSFIAREIEASRLEWHDPGTNVRGTAWDFEQHFRESSKYKIKPSEFTEFGLCVTSAGSAHANLNSVLGMLLLYVFVVQDLYRLIFVDVFHWGVRENVPMTPGYILLFASAFIGHALVNIMVALGCGRAVLLHLTNFDATITSAVGGAFFILQVDDIALPLLVKMYGIQVGAAIGHDHILQHAETRGALKFSFGTVSDVSKLILKNAVEGRARLPQFSKRFWMCLFCITAMTPVAVLIAPLTISVYDYITARPDVCVP